MLNLNIIHPRGKMSEMEDELPDIDIDDICHQNGRAKDKNNFCNLDSESEGSDIEVIWEGNNSQHSLKSDDELPDLPCTSSSVVKPINKPCLPLISDSDTDDDCVRVMLPKKKQKPKVMLNKGKEKQRKLIEKENQREVKRIEKEIKLQEELRAKELRKATSEIQKSVKPGESIKHMTILLDPEISQKYDALVPILVSGDIKYHISSDSLISSSIQFKRELMQQVMGDDLKITLDSKFIDEDQVIIVLESDKVIPMVAAQLKKQSGSQDEEENGLDFTTWVESVKSVLLGKKLTFFLMDMDKYFRQIKKNTQKEFRNRVLNTGNIPVQNKRKLKQSLPDISQTELYGSLIEMQLQTGVNYRIINNVKELGSSLIQYTKAIADAPFKKQRIESNGFDWFALADATGSVKVEKDGTGLKQLWTEQLQQFNNIGPDMAVAISNRYLSPMKLLEAYRSCENQEQGETLLKNLSVTTGVGPLARTRKIGHENSKKLYRFFTSTNGDRFLGSTLDTR